MSGFVSPGSFLGFPSWFFLPEKEEGTPVIHRTWQCRISPPSPPWDLKSVLEFFLDHSRALRYYFLFGSGSLQERSKRTPRGFLKASASKMRLGPHLRLIFLLRKESRGPQKSRKSYRESTFFCNLHIFSSIRFGSQFFDPLGFAFGRPFRLQAIRHRCPRRP